MSHHRTRFYVVNDSREDPTERWIVAAFVRRMDAEQYSGDVGGQIHTVNDDGLPELIEQWQQGNDIAAARHQARAMIATADSEFADAGITLEDDLDLIERYAEQEAACSAYLRLRALTQEAKYIISQVIPDGAAMFEGVALTRRD